ncbi:3-hydroxyacyl-CoA dehydrogenase [Corynebacterium lehmanniae]
MTFNNVTVLGAGVLGAQIAFCSAFAGKKVVSYDINEEALAAGKKRFDAIGEQMKAELESANDETIAAGHANLTQTSDLKEAVANADLVIEAIPENLELKRKVWAEVGEYAPETAVFATNTSTLMPSKFADATGAPERFLALHFANHIWIQNTAEIMPHEGTDPKYVDQLVEFAEQINMVPVPLKREQPGYVLNTLLVPLLSAGMYLLHQDVAEPADIDRDWRNSTGSPRGPFEIMDLIGVRTLVAVIQSDENAADWKKQFARETLEPMIAAGKTGIEAGQGFYTYDANGKIVS